MLYLVTLKSYSAPFCCQKVEFDDEKREVIIYKPEFPSPCKCGYINLHIPLDEVVNVKVLERFC